MAKLDIKGLNYITSSNKLSTFNLDFSYTDDGHILGRSLRESVDLSSIRRRTFFADIGEEESMSLKYNTNIDSLYDLSSGFIIHNIYDLTRSKLKSTIFVDKDCTKTIDIYAPAITTDFLDMCQFETYAYALTERTEKSPLMLSVLFNNKNNNDYSYVYLIASENITTNSYRPFDLNYSLETIGTIHQLLDSGTMDIVSTYNLYVLSGGPDSLSSRRMFEVFEPTRRYSGVKYNYLLEIPENKNYNSYQNGYIYCDTFVCKNSLNPDYTMDLDNYGNTISSCRDYAGIGTCGGAMFMKYRVNSDYQKSTRNSLDDEKTVLIDVSENSNREYSYLHVEVVESLNRYDANMFGHKSNMFSIRLNNTGLNTTDISENIKSKLRQNITNSIRTIAEKVCPANTLLFNVYFAGK